MGRCKVHVKKIENKAKCQATFSKRRRGLIKKAYELSVLCDIDVALIYFSMTGKLNFFSSRSRIEDVLIRFLNGPDQQVAPSFAPPNKESLVVLLENLKVQEDEIAGESSSQQQNDQTGSKAVEDVDQELVNCQNRLETLKGYLRLLYGDEPPMTSPSDFDERSRKIMEMHSKIKERKNYLLNLSAPSPCSMPITQMQSQEQQSNIMLENMELVPTQPQEDITTMSVPPRMESLDSFWAEVDATTMPVHPEVPMQVESYSMDSFWAEVNATTMSVAPRMDMQVESYSMDSFWAEVDATTMPVHPEVPMQPESDSMVGLSAEDPSLEEDFLGLNDSLISFDSQEFLINC